MDSSGQPENKTNTRLRRLRKRMNITQADLAGLTGTTRQKIIAIEDGYIPNLLIALRLARYFGTTVEVLFAEPARQARVLQPQVRRRRARVSKFLDVLADEVPVFLVRDHETI